ncbi:hypothetical protein RRG08_059254 [Elysia crispata]|uniref:Uncharacterized protein n=1 Tax=Elysia crispata TaxID=231223 RepID=A0AAE0Y880_9GAST|nr:hypothetical protein RRG08_059254 [Elysia crispata]
MESGSKSFLGNSIVVQQMYHYRREIQVSDPGVREEEKTVTLTRATRTSLYQLAVFGQGTIPTRGSERNNGGPEILMVFAHAHQSDLPFMRRGKLNVEEAKVDQDHAVLTSSRNVQEDRELRFIPLQEEEKNRVNIVLKAVRAANFYTIDAR